MASTIALTDANPGEPGDAPRFAAPLPVVLGTNDAAHDPFGAGDVPDDEPQGERFAASTGMTEANMVTLGETIAAGVARGMAVNAPRRRVTLGEYDPKTWAQPDKRKTHRLQRECYQNGGWMNPNSMTNKEIDGLNAITHSGRYINRLVEVVIRPNGAEDEVHLRYNNKTIAQRLDFKGHVQSLEHLLDQVNAAQVEERLEYEADSEARRERINRARFAAQR